MSILTPEGRDAIIAQYQEKKALLRQREEVNEKLRNLKAKSIARRLGISPSTVYSIWEECRGVEIA